jgi:hypothetical protein
LFIAASEIVLEPAAGAGQIASPLKQAGLQVVTNDIAYGMITWQCRWCQTVTHTPAFSMDFAYEYKMESCSNDGCIHYDQADPLAKTLISTQTYDTDYHMDASEPQLWHDVSTPAWTITNPPYKAEILDRILERALTHSTHGVAMLLRLTALEPVIKRGNRGNILRFYQDKMTHLIPFSSPRPSYTGDGKTDAVTTAWFVWQHGWSWSQRNIDPPFQFAVNWLTKPEPHKKSLYGVTVDRDTVPWSTQKHGR